jgi:hypothetical protein
VGYAAATTGAVVVDWPVVYFSVGPFLYSTTVSIAASLTLSAPVLRATLRSPARSMVVNGDQLLVAEQPGAYGGSGVAAVEAFLIASGGTISLAGSYELNDSYDVQGSIVTAMQVSGSNVFLFMNGGTSAALDVAEMGSPRYMSRLGTAATNGMFPISVAARGSRALAVMQNGFSTYELHSIDMHGNFAGTNVPFGHSNSYTSSFGVNTCGVDPQAFSNSIPCNPIAVWGDYAFVAREPAAPGATPIDIYDVSTLGVASGGGTSFGAPLASVTASAGVTGLAASNGYLVASVASPSHYLEWWDLTSIAHPTPVSPATGNTLSSSSMGYGHSLSFFGRYVYVTTGSGFCIANIFPAAKGLTGPGEVSCTTMTGPAGASPISGYGLFVDGANLYVAAHTGVGATTAVSELRQYDVSTPTNATFVTAFVSGPYAPASVLRTGPYVLAPMPAASNLITGYFLPSTGAPLLIGSVTDFTYLTNTGVTLAGPFLLAPDLSNGVAMIRMY